jgi:hypothetical protein
VNTVCHDKTAIKGATDLMQQPELCNELLTSLFIKIRVIQGPKFIIKIGENFFLGLSNS